MDIRQIRTKAALKMTSKADTKLERKWEKRQKKAKETLDVDNIHKATTK